MPVKRHPTLSKGKKKTVTPDTVRKKFAKGAPKRQMKKRPVQAEIAMKSGATDKVKPKRPRT
jgi:hypothetical protein